MPKKINYENLHKLTKVQSDIKNDVQENQKETVLTGVYKGEEVVSLDVEKFSLDQYKRCRNQLISLLNYIYKLDCKKFHIFDELKDSIEEKLPVPENLQKLIKAQKRLYGNSIPMFQMLPEHLKNDIKKALGSIKLTLENSAIQIIDFSKSSKEIEDVYTLNECLNGAITNLNDIMTNHFIRPSLEDIIISARTKIIKEYAAHFLKQVNDANIIEGTLEVSEIHFVNGLYDHYAKKYKLPLIMDDGASCYEDIIERHADAFNDYIEKNFNLDKLVEKLMLDHPLPNLTGDGMKDMDNIKQFFSYYKADSQDTSYWEELYQYDDETGVLSAYENINDRYKTFLIKLIEEKYLPKNDYSKAHNIEVRQNNHDLAVSQTEANLKIQPVWKATAKGFGKGFIAGGSVSAGLALAIAHFVTPVATFVSTFFPPAILLIPAAYVAAIACGIIGGLVGGAIGAAIAAQKQSKHNQAQAVFQPHFNSEVHNTTYTHPAHVV